MTTAHFSFRARTQRSRSAASRGSLLLCMGLFSRFFVQALPCTAEGTVCRVRDTRSLVPRAYGTNRSSSNTSCSSRQLAAKIAPALGLERDDFSSNRHPALYLFVEHDLRANASRLSRGGTGTHPSGRGPRACFSGSCSKA